MKMRTIAIAMALAGIAGTAAAGQADAVLQTAIVSGSTVTTCPHPFGTGNPACAALNRLVRANFTRREIDILFGTLASDSWYRRASFAQLQKRYLAVVHQYAAQQGSTRQSIADE